MRLLLTLLMVCCTSLAWNQLTEHFTDGDFSANPTWSGTDPHYIINPSLELQVNNTVAATSYLSTPHLLLSLDDKQWDIKVKQTFSSSTSNFGRVYLTASSADLTTNPDGFYLQFGEAGATDAVRLFKCVSGVSTAICASPDGQIANSFTARVKVIRNASGQWSLYVDPTGGTNYGAPYVGTDATALIGTHFGVMQTYTASNANKFFYDDIYIGNEILDTQAPSLTSVSVISANQVDILFSEPVAGASVQQIGNYSLNPAIGISTAIQDGINTALVHLTLSANLTNGQTYQLTAASIADIAGNTATNLLGNFTYLVGELAVKGDLIITEMMVDPSPVVGLPELEFVEIYNRSSKYINLAGWQIGDQSGDGTISSGFINPGQYIVLCATASLTEFPGALGVSSFPSFNNNTDDVVLKNPSGVIFDKITYFDTWYQDPIKKNGGYTLELINPNDPCSDASNWIASTHVTGGTPGLQNSVYNTTPDTQVPSITSLIAGAPNFLQITFSEGMDSLSLVNAIVNCTPNLTVQSLYVGSTNNSQVVFEFAQNIQESEVYTITYGPVSDCWLNNTSISGTFALASAPVAGDLIINEILFSPETGGSDFVELYNRSSKIINLNGLTIQNFNDDTIQLTQNYLVFPNEYVVLTPDSNFQKNSFPEAVSGTFYKTALPTLNSDSSSFYVYYNSVLLDKVSYSSKWHFSLLDNTKNKSLERIDTWGVSDSKTNWHTAAESVGFATPGRINSQNVSPETPSGTFETETPIFSPDNDGFQDVMIFKYQLDAGMIGTLKIFDSQGREIITLFSNELLGQQGTYTWDGTTTTSQKAPIGVYMAVIEVFSESGGKPFAKRVAFTLAGQLK